MSVNQKLLQAGFRARRRATAALLLGSLLSLPACSTQPLSVKMVHPKTKAVATCSAREPARADVPREVLANAVSACVKQLEARGFKRAD